MTRSSPGPPSPPEAPPSQHHALSVEETLALLGTDQATGLSEEEAARRLARYGPNALAEGKATPWYAVLGRQFTSPLILLLLLAAGIALGLGEVIDALAILIIVILNGVLGFFQEWKAERSLAALRNMLAPTCKVLRGGRHRESGTKHLVPGDLVILETGDLVPADLRLVEAVNLKTDESTLTGESEPSTKDTIAVPAENILAERASMAWMGTSVAYGRGRGAVVTTGHNTEFGRIATLSRNVEDEESPLQTKLATLGKQLGIFGISISGLVAVAGILTGKPAGEMFLTGVSLAVAVVPEGLPAVVTVTLALGIRAMVRRKALLRRLQAAETLGAATVICTDKTGTLTKNQMTVQRIFLARGELGVTGTGYQPNGMFLAGKQQMDPATSPDLLAFLESALACSNASLSEESDGWHAIGEPTEAALVTAAFKAGVRKKAAEHFVTEIPFTSERKRMTVVERRKEGFLAHVKGAPDVLLPRCTALLDGGSKKNLDEAEKRRVETAIHAMAQTGLRTLAVARRELPAEAVLTGDELEQDLVFLGIAGMLDPPREEVPQALALAKTAGIKVVMITGDAAETAQAIAERVGLASEHTVTGPELDRLSQEELRQVLRGNAIFARTAPEHKLRLITALQDMGHVAGMTGDGVNDAPALKKADIGIAMGLRGTDVARGAADMVLMDDNFATIISAVEEGRRQYDNIQKFVRYLLSSNVAEVAAIAGNIIIGGPMVLLPVQILWMNLITDGITAVALGVEPPEKGLMARPPRKSSAAILDQWGLGMIVSLGLLMGLGVLGIFHAYLFHMGSEGVMYAQTVAFTTLIMMEKFNVFNFRSLQSPLIRNGFFSNPWLIGAWMANLGLQIGAVYVPFMQKGLGTVGLRAFDWLVVFGAAIPVFALAEMVKWRRAAVNGEQ